MTDDGANVHVLSAGNPEHVRFTVLVKPSTGDTVMIRLLVVVPRVFDANPAAELLNNTKSGEAISGALVEPA